MIGVGRDLCGSSSPTPLPKQGHLELAAQDFVQAGLEYFQRGRLHNLPGQPVTLIVTLSLISLHKKRTAIGVPPSDIQNRSPQCRQRRNFGEREKYVYIFSKKWLIPYGKKPTRLVYFQNVK